MNKKPEQFPRNPFVFFDEFIEPPDSNNNQTYLKSKSIF